MESSLHLIDYAIVLTVIAVFIAIGIKFSRKQSTTQQYYVASGSLPSWAIGLSILATLISSVTFLAYPGAAFSGNWILLVQGLMVPVVLVFLVGYIVPFYREVVGVSAYEYFEKRFGYFARLYTSLAFTVAHFSKMGTVFFLLALAISSMMGVEIHATIMVLGAVVILYTLIGGIEAVIWLDVLQGILLLSGAVLGIGILFATAPDSPMALIRFASEQGKIGFAPYDWDFTRLTFIVIAINGLFYGVQKYGTDQTIVQRYLTAKSHKDAVRASLMGVFLCIPVWMLFMFLGSLLFSYYSLGGGTPLAEGIRPDAVFPHFILNEMPPGLTGLILAGLVAAAFSSLDSDLNSLSAVGVEDYYKRFRPDRSDAHYLGVGKVIVIACGIAALGVALIYVEAEDTVLEIVFSLYAIFSGGIAGLFMLGLFTRSANKKGIYIGIAACVLFTAWAILTSKPIGLAEAPPLDLGAFRYTHHSYMMGVYTHLILFGVGYLASRLFPSEPAADNLTIHGYLKKRETAGS